MSFQKKSKPTASVGNPSPKTLRKSKATRTTKSEARVDPDNNNSQESLEQDFDKKLDLESKFYVRKQSSVHCAWSSWFIFSFNRFLSIILNFSWSYVNVFPLFSPTCCLLAEYPSLKPVNIFPLSVFFPFFESQSYSFPAVQSSSSSVALLVKSEQLPNSWWQLSSCICMHSWFLSFKLHFCSNSAWLS